MIPFVTLDDPMPGRADRLSDRVIRVIANNPGPFTYTGTGTYLIGDAKGVAVIDPGPDDPAHIDAIQAASPGPITDILVTHTHRDHSAGAALLADATSATVHGYGTHPHGPNDAPMALDEGADFEFRPTALLRDSDQVSGPSFTLTTVHTPGHTDNHLCFALAEEGALFTGDHIMGWSTTVIAPPDGNMGDYMASLDILSARTGDRIYYPTHGAPIRKPHAFVDAVRQHRQHRDTSILAAIGTSRVTVKDIVEDVYASTPKALHPAAALNVIAHLETHIGTGRVIQDAEGRYCRPGEA